MSNHKNSLSTETTKTAAELTTVETGNIDFGAIKGLPTDPQERNELRKKVTFTLDRLFLSRLSEREQKLIRDHWPNLPNPDLKPILQRFDKFILDQACAIGWQVFMSDGVIGRIAMWWCQEEEKNGPQLLERLGKALALGARARRGLAPLPMDTPDWHETKIRAKSELRPLLKRLRDTVSMSNKTPRIREICSFVREEIRSKSSYLYLRENLASLLGFLQYLESSGAAMANRLAIGARVSPAEFFDAWGAWATNRQEDAFRQKISGFRNAEN